MYHPYCHSPSALTEYLKQKLRSQRARRLSCSLPAQVEQDVPLECNKFDLSYASSAGVGDGDNDDDSASEGSGDSMRAFTLCSYFF